MGPFGQLSGQLGGLQQGGPENWLAFVNGLKSLFEGNFNIGDHAQWSRPNGDMADKLREQVSQWAQPQQTAAAPVGPPSQATQQATGNPAQPNAGQSAQRPMANALAGVRQQFGGGGNDLRNRLGIGF